MVFPGKIKIKKIFFIKRNPFVFLILWSQLGYLFCLLHLLTRCYTQIPYLGSTQWLRWGSGGLQDHGGQARDSEPSCWPPACVYNQTSWHYPMLVDNAPGKQDKHKYHANYFKSQIFLNTWQLWLKFTSHKTKYNYDTVRELGPQKGSDKRQDTKTLGPVSLKTGNLSSMLSKLCTGSAGSLAPRPKVRFHSWLERQKWCSLVDAVKLPS